VPERERRDGVAYTDVEASYFERLNIASVELSFRFAVWITLLALAILAGLLHRLWVTGEVYEPLRREAAQAA
jgi:hypothetical protein